MNEFKEKIKRLSSFDKKTLRRSMKKFQMTGKKNIPQDILAKLDAFESDSFAILIEIAILQKDLKLK